MKHTNDLPQCPSCEEKLKSAHPDLAGWFQEHVKPGFPQAHVSWTFRDKKNQDQCFLDGKSKLKWPLSAHNKSDDQGNPCALAVDLFQLDFNGIARWGWAFFRSIAEQAKSKGMPIKWGGDWKTLGDADHFQLEII